MVGMAVARALCEHFKEVVLIERDTLPRDVPAHRRGVQQSHHIHGLLRYGQQALDDLFPGYTAEAVRLGAIPLDFGRDVARCTDLGFCPLFETGYSGLSATRVLLEFVERKRFGELVSNAKVLENTKVQELITEGEGKNLRAVGVRTDHPEHAEIRGQLVVDCSGRAALWRGWFAERNLPLPPETIVDSKCGYASRFYRVDPSSPYARMGMSVDQLFPHRPQWGVITPAEDNQWVVTIGGFNGQYPPGDEEGFERFGDRFQTPLFQEWLSQATPASQVRTFRKMEMRWNHFEKDPGAIKNFLAVGDTLYAFNPLYGQGMSVGIGCARILRDVVRKDANLDTLQKRFYREATKFAFPVWHSTALLDLAWPGTEGKRPWYTELSRRMGHTFLRACQFDDELFIGLLQGAHLEKKPHQLLRPRILYGMLRYYFKRITNTLPQMDLKRLPARRDTAHPALPEDTRRAA